MNTLWTFLLTLPVTMIPMVVLGRVLLRPWRATEGQHWTERARVLWPARMGLQGISGGATAGSALLWHWLQLGEMSVTGLVGGALVGTVLGSYPFSRTTAPHQRFGAWLRRQVWVNSSVIVYLAIFLSLLTTLSENLHTRDWLLAGVGFVALIWVRLGLWIRWLSHPVSSTNPNQVRLAAVVEAESKRLNIPVRRLWVADIAVANAMALPHLAELIFTQRALEILSDEELAAICRHELGHLSEPKHVIFLRIVGGLCLFPLVFLNSIMAHWGLPGFIVSVCLVLLLFRAVQRLRRRMEVRADAAAVTEDDESKKIYARSLEKLYEDNLIPAVMRSGRVHPSLYDRMLAAGVTPDYPRPLPPRRMSWIGWAALLIPAGMLIARYGGWWPVE